MELNRWLVAKLICSILKKGIPQSKVNPVLRETWTQAKNRSFFSPHLAFSSSQFHQHFTDEFFVRTLFWQLFSSYMYVVKAAKTTFGQKTRAYILRMHFSYKILVPKITKLCFGFGIFWRQNINAKCAHKMLMKLTPPRL